MDNRINSYQFKVTLIDPETMQEISKDDYFNGKVRTVITPDGTIRAWLFIYNNQTKELIVKYAGK